MFKAKAKSRAEVAIRPTPYPQVAVETAYTLERLENLGASKRDCETVTRGLVAGVIASVSAYSVGNRDGATRDAVRIDYDHGKRQAGRHMYMDFSGRQSVTEQIDRADAALLTNQIGRFSRKGRTTQVEVTYTPDVYQNPDRYEEVSRTVGTQPVSGQRQWKGGGYEERSRITPGAFRGTVTTSDQTHRRPRKR